MYKASPMTEEDENNLVRYFQRELSKIENAFLVLEIDTADFRVWYTLPPKPREGAIAYLDNSISGITTTGLHEYQGGAWVKL